MYKEYTNSIQTEFGQLDLIYMIEDDVPTVQVWLNYVRIAVPNHWLTQTSSTIARKVCALVRTAQRQGVKIGG